MPSLIRLMQVTLVPAVAVGIWAQFNLGDSGPTTSWGSYLLHEATAARLLVSWLLHDADDSRQRGDTKLKEAIIADSEKAQGAERRKVYVPLRGERGSPSRASSRRPFQVWLETDRQSV